VSASGHDPTHEPRLTTGIRAGFEAFGDAAWGWLRLALLFGVLLLLGFAVSAFLFPPWWDEVGSPWAVAYLVPEVALTVLSSLMTMAAAAVALQQMRTRSFEMARAWEIVGRGPVWTVVVPLSIGIVLLDTAGGWLWLGTLLSVPILMYTPFLLADGASAEDSLRDGLRLLAVRPGQQVALFGLTVLVALGGALACFVGLLVALPVISLAYAWAYCHLTRRPAEPLEATG